MTQHEKVLVVSIINALIKDYCKKGFSSVDDPVGVFGIGIIDGEIQAADGDTLDDTLGWVLTDIIPPLLSDEA